MRLTKRNIPEIIISCNNCHALNTPKYNRYSLIDKQTYILQKAFIHQQSTWCAYNIKAKSHHVNQIINNRCVLHFRLRCVEFIQANVSLDYSVTVASASTSNLIQNFILSKITIRFRKRSKSTQFKFYC